MSILFPKVNKSRQWDYRPIYYDPEKDERHERLRELKEEREAEKKDRQTDGSYKPHLHRGSFREAAEKNNSVRVREGRKSNIRFFIIVLILLIIVFYFLI